MKNMFGAMRDLGLKKMIALFILAAVDVFIIAAPYYLKAFIPNIHLYLHVREDHVTSFTAVLGWVTLLTQLPGGWLADKFSSKKLLMIASMVTGLATVWFGTLALVGNNLSQTDLVSQYYTIFSIWGISSTPFFWTPLWKLVSQQGDQKNQGFVYGMQGSLNGLIGIFFIFAIGTIIVLYTDSLQEANTIPFATYAYIIAGLLIALTFGIYWFVKEKPSTEKFAINFKSFFNVMSDWKTWALSIFVMGMYMFQSTFAFFLNQFLINVVNDGNSTAFSTVILVVGGIRLYGMRFIVSSWIGHYSDRMKSMTGFLLITLLAGLIVTVIFFLLPGISSDPFANSFTNLDPSYKLFVTIFLFALFLLTSFLSWTMVTLRYAQMAEIQRPKNSYASTTAALSFIGFSSDAWFYTAGSAIGKLYTPEGELNTSQTGYQVIILLGLVVALIGWFGGFSVFMSNYKLNKKYGLSFYRWRELNNA